MKLKWNVYKYNCNKKKIEEFNIFNHGCFNEDVQTLLRPGFSKDYFEHRLKALLQYYFWSKSEYEILISPWIGDENASQKIDIYNQILINWDKFVDYVWSFRDKSEEKIHDKEE